MASQITIRPWAARDRDAVQGLLSLHDEKVTLVSFGELGLGIPGLRERRLITDSPRVLARDDRAALER